MSKGKKRFGLLVVGLTLLVAIFAVVGLGGGVAKAQTPFSGTSGNAFSASTFRGMMGYSGIGNMMGNNGYSGMMGGWYGQSNPNNTNTSPNNSAAPQANGPRATGGMMGGYRGGAPYNSNLR